MKFYLLIIIWVMIFNISNAYSFWKQLPYDPSIYDLYSMDIGTDNSAVAVGDLGCVAMTTDTGSTWKYSFVSGAEKLYSVYCQNLTNLIVGGEKGCIYKTFNQGLTWYRSYTDTYENIIKFCFLSKSTGFGITSGGTVLKTTDYGLNWLKKFKLDSGSFNDIVSYKDKELLAIGKNFLISSKDSGVTWQYINTGIYGNYRKIGITKDNYIYLISDSLKVVYSQDEGKSWKQFVLDEMNQSNFNNCNVQGFHFFENMEYFRIKGLKTIEIYTTDKWATKKVRILSDMHSDFGINVNNLKFYNKSIGLGAASGGNIYKQEWGEEDFAYYYLNITQHKSLQNFWKIAAADENNYIVLDKEGRLISRTSDHGNNWDIINIDYYPCFSSYKCIFESVSFPNKDHFFLGYNDARLFQVDPKTKKIFYTPIVIYSHDGGISLQRYQCPDELRLTKIHMIDENFGALQLKANKIKYTNNGCMIWNDIFLPDTMCIINNLAVFGPGKFYAYCQKRNEIDTTKFVNLLFRTYDNGNNWEQYENNYYGNLSKTQFIDEIHGWAIGAKTDNLFDKNYIYNFIAKTEDGGISWNEVYVSDSTSSTNIFTDLDFLNFNNGLVAGNYLPLMRTNNAGKTWFKDSLPSYQNNAFEVVYPNNNTAMAIGYDSRLYMNFDLPTDIESNLSGDGYISIIPNPISDMNFIVKLHSSYSGYVRIELINNLGNKILELYNGNINPGENNLTFNLKEPFVSGIYWTKAVIDNQIVIVEPIIIIK